MSVADRLSRSQDIRWKMIDKLMENGEPPTDPKAIRLLQSLLNDSDQHIYDAERIQIDEQNANTMERATAQVEELFSKYTPRVINGDATAIGIGEIPKPILPPSDLKPDEFKTGYEVIDYDELLDKHLKR